MFSPTVTELPRHLEAISPDPFNDGGSAAIAPALPSNVIELSPAVYVVRSPALAAA
jgi:hypothetical protein